MERPHPRPDGRRHHRRHHRRATWRSAARIRPRPAHPACPCITGGRQRGRAHRPLELGKQTVRPRRPERDDAVVVLRFAERDDLGRRVDLIEAVLEQHRLRLVAAADPLDDGLQPAGDRRALGGAFVNEVDGAELGRLARALERRQLLPRPAGRPVRIVSGARRCSIDAESSMMIVCSQPPSIMRCGVSNAMTARVPASVVRSNRPSSTRIAQ